MKEEIEDCMARDENMNIRLLPKGLFVHALGGHSEQNLKMAQKVHDVLYEFLEDNNLGVIPMDGALDFGEIKVLKNQ